MNIHEHMTDRVELAYTYSEDGAFLSAARILRQLAEDLEAHHAARSPADEPAE